MEIVWLLYAVIGLMSGFISGLIGVGGGIIIIPALTVFCGFTQKMAQGTSMLLLLPPIGVLAVREYVKNKNVDLSAAVFIAIGLLLASYLGAKTAVYLPEKILVKVFSVMLMVMSLVIWFKGEKND